MGYVGSVIQHSFGSNGHRLSAQGCSLPLAQLLDRRLEVVLDKLRAAYARLKSGGRVVRQVLKDNFLSDSREIQLRAQARVAEAIKHAERALAGEIVIQCLLVAPNDCPCNDPDGTTRPACIIPARGLDRIIICNDTFRAQIGGTTRQQQILLHELFHRAGLRGPNMHAVQLADIDCDRRGHEKRGVRELAKGGVDPLEVIDLHVRAVWCLAALGSP